MRRRTRRTPGVRAVTVSLGLALAGLVVAGCDSDRRAISRDDLPEVPEEADHVVVLGDDGFDTEELVVASDDLVEFRITGDDDHGIRADTRIDTGLLFPGESTFVIFDEPGTYEVVDLTDEDQVLVVESLAAEDPESGSALRVGQPYELDSPTNRTTRSVRRRTRRPGATPRSR